jgi:subtilase family serine protease
VSNVKLDEGLPAIPDWVTTFVEARSKCRTAAITIIGIHKYHRTTVTGNNDINVIKLISEHIWSTRLDDGSVSPPKETKTIEQLIEELEQ